MLRNKAGIRDQDALDQFEQLMFLSRAEEAMPTGTLDADHYKKLHHHFFQDVYDWAGDIRTVRTAKGGNWFCYPEHIETELTRIFSQLQSESHLTGLTNAGGFASRAAYFLSELNAVHPFREGNGRTQLVFLTLLCQNAGFELDETALDEVAFMTAMIESFRGSTEPLARTILAMIT